MGARDYDMTLFAAHNQEIAQVSPDSFPRERVGSGDKTNVTTVHMRCLVCDLVYWVFQGHMLKLRSHPTNKGRLTS